MKTIVAKEGPLAVHSGQVTLTAEQAASRRHALKAVEVNPKTGAGVYEVLQTIQFKRGERFGYDGEVGKNGELRDREAEEIARLEAAKRDAEKVAELVKAAEKKGREEGAAEARAKLIDELQRELGPIVKELPAEVQAKLSAPFDKVFGPAPADPAKK